MRKYHTLAGVTVTDIVEDLSMEEQAWGKVNFVGL
jgi:hypothetical protein